MISRGRLTLARSGSFKVLPALSISVGLLASCSTIDQARTAASLGIETALRLNLDALVEAETDRKRFRRARCYSPLLSPAAIGAGVMDARLGRPWLDELLQDCPYFSAAITQLVIDRRRSFRDADAVNPAVAVAK